jgi:hypothetical protein
VRGTVQVMSEARRFDASTLDRMRDTREIRLQTTSLHGTATHRTIIWIVTVGDEAFIRSVRGPAGRWYREARERPEVVVHVEGESIPATAVLANDSETIETVSDAFTAKYGKRSPSTASMLRPHTLETTLRLEPRESTSAV